MDWDLETDQLDAIVNALLAPAPARGGEHARQLMQRIAKSGWMEDYMLDDLLYAVDERLRPYPHGVEIEAIAKALEIPKISVTRRPRASSANAQMLAARSSFDTASLLIALEDLGFAVDPRPLIELIRPEIPKQGFITAAQLDVLWYAQRRLARTTGFRAKGPPRTREIEDRKLATGHRLEIHRDNEGKAVALNVKGPKYRRRPEPVKTTCPDCGHVWYRGDSDSSAAHRREHRERMVFLDPLPDERVIDARLIGDDPELVTFSSPSWKHKAMDDRARIFRREEGYSFVGWGVRGERDTRARGHLFTSDDGAIIGACAFRWRTYQDAEPRWALQWIWVCPKFRRTGVLRQRWKQFREEYGEFVIEAPVSDAMVAFVSAMGDDALLKPEL